MSCTYGELAKERLFCDGLTLKRPFADAIRAGTGSIMCSVSQYPVNIYPRSRRVM